MVGVQATADCNVAEETLSLMDQKKPHAFPTVRNNLAHKFLDRRFPGRSDVGVDSTAANSSVLAIVNFSGNSCQLG